MADEPNVTERQAKWFASVRASLETSTGKSLEEWVTIAHTCPETAHRARLRWFKETHGLLQNRASYVIDQAFGSSMPWQAPEALVDALWTDDASRTIYEALDGAALALPGTVRTARKSYTAWSRTFQYAAARPLKDGGAMLGLAVAPEVDARLEAPKNESWSERLKARTRLDSPAAVDGRISELLRAAWEKA
ncbi:MAG: DUF5655 domain-containing protein [Caulobacteraceae bacterium]